MCSQKNRNLLRGLKKTFCFERCTQRPYVLTFCLLLSAFCLLTLSSCDPEERIISRWNLQEVLVNNEPYEDSTQFHLLTTHTYYYFYYMNSLEVRTYANGKPQSAYDGFYQFVDRSTIYMRFTLLWEFNEITAKIKKLTQRELHLEYEEDGDVYYLKLYSN